MGSVRRTSWRKFIPFVILNVIVSVLSMSLVLTIWDRGVQVEPPTPTPTLSALSVAASAVPTATATIRPSATPHTYTVKSGDTINAIALELGVSADELMAANGLVDPDTLSAGQVLLVPSSGGSNTAPASTAAPASPTSVPTQAGGEAPQVDIRGVDGAGDLETEVVRLINSGGVANMAGWTLDDGRSHRYIFPAFTLHNGAVSVHTKAGSDTVIDLYWGLPEAVWTPGTTISLRNGDGELLSTFQIPSN
ncbi:MAG: LysM peptidoglycan-binding domain-containing protein [Anaerolineales bacterium]